MSKTTAELLGVSPEFSPFAVRIDREPALLVYKRRYRNNHGPRCPFCNTGQGYRAYTDTDEILVSECRTCGATIVQYKSNTFERCLVRLDEAWSFPRAFLQPDDEKRYEWPKEWANP